MAWMVGTKDSMESPSLWVMLLSIFAMCQLLRIILGSFFTISSISAMALDKENKTASPNFYNISSMALDKENKTASPNSQQPTHPPVERYQVHQLLIPHLRPHNASIKPEQMFQLGTTTPTKCLQQDSLTTTKDGYITYDEDGPVSGQRQDYVSYQKYNACEGLNSQGSEMFSIYELDPQASPSLIKLTFFLALISHRRECFTIPWVNHITSSMTFAAPIKIAGFNEVGRMVQMESHNLNKHIIKLEFGFNSSPMQSGNGKMSMIEHGLMIQLLLLPLLDVPDPGLNNGHPHVEHNPVERSNQSHGQQVTLIKL